MYNTCKHPVKLEQAPQNQPRWVRSALVALGASPTPADLLQPAAEDVLAHMHFPREHRRRRLHSTNPLERQHEEVKRRTRVVGIFPNRDSLRRMVVALLQEQDAEGQVADRRYLSIGSMKRIGELEGGEVPELLAAIA